MSYGYKANGTDCGDFWHESVEKATAWTARVYGVPVGSWEKVPPTEPNAHNRAVEYLRLLGR
jgi:hypothetical protein